MFMMYLDLAEIDKVFRGRWLWSATRPAPAWFRRGDYAGDPAVPLDLSIRNLVREKTGVEARGPIRLLTHLRYFGHIFNPVSFYYCFDEADTGVETIVAEITNTPWKERHCYVLPSAMNEGTQGKKRFRFHKDFHISPFMAMEQDYDWRFIDPSDSLVVHMVNSEKGQRVFDATVHLRRREISAATLARALVRFPLITVQVVAGIYWNALRLRLKNTPFHPHPSKGKSIVEVSSR